MSEHKEKDPGLERVVLFSDAVVAIAITLLALELRLELPEDHHLTFKDLLEPWHKYLAFFLSFIMIADFWRSHYEFFKAITKMDPKLLAINTCWLFFIVTLPFAASVLSDHFGDPAAIFLYSLVVFAISVCQNFLWDYPSARGYIDETEIHERKLKSVRTVLNLDMLNGLIAVGVSFFFPKLAFFLLFFKLPMIFIPVIILRKRRQRLELAQHKKAN